MQLVAINKAPLDSIATSSYYYILDIDLQSKVLWTTMARFLALLFACLPQLFLAFNVGGLRSSPLFKASTIRVQSRLSMSFGGISEKLGGLVEFISGQQKVTEANIEDTLKVKHAFGFQNRTLNLLISPRSIYFSTI